MQVQQIDYILAVADAGTFALAAERTHVSRQLISRSIANAERQLGFELFEKRNRLLVPTETSAPFIEKIRALSNDYHQIHEDYALTTPHGPAQMTRQQPVVSIALSHIFSALPSCVDWITGASLKCDSSFRCEFLNSTLTVDEVANHRCDFGVVETCGRRLAQFDSQMICKRHPALWTNDPQLIGKPYVTITDLHERRIVTMGWYNHIRQSLFEACKDHGITPDIRMETNSAELATNVSLQTDSSILAELLEMENPLIKHFTPVRLVLDETEDLGFYLFRRKGSLFSKPVREAWDMLLENRSVIGFNGCKDHDL